MAAEQDNPDRPAGLDVRLPGYRNNPEGSMPLLEHIRELRSRMLKAMLFVAIGAAVGWFVYPALWHFIEGPYCKLNLAASSQIAGTHGCTLYVTGVFDGFF